MDYEICVESHLNSTWSEWLHNLTITHEANGQTRLTGSLVDQSALLSVLNKLHDLGINLISVNRSNHESHQS